MTQCGWCEREATTKVKIREGKYTGVGKERRQVVPPYMVPVCPDHMNIVKEQPKFYTCGCSYVSGEMKCPVHDNKLRKQFRGED